jgi:ribosomal protein L20
VRKRDMRSLWIQRINAGAQFSNHNPAPAPHQLQTFYLRAAKGRSGNRPQHFRG